ncbi:MAG: AbrB family transcriptional regulator [Candidatus Puniceispirillaceae bacterium]
MIALGKYRGFSIALIPAAMGGAIWSGLGLPLAWLMGAAIVTGFISFSGLQIKLPKGLYLPSLAVIGAGVGLTITPDVALQISRWFPMMAVMGFAGVVLALLLTPIVARKAEMKHSTAFFSLMPGGVIEMANIGEPHGADRTTIATLHAIRVALVVGILPLGLFFFFPSTGLVSEVVQLSAFDLLLVLFVALLGGWLGQKYNLPAAWLLGALLAVALLTATGAVDGQIPEALMAIAQIFVGMSLGAKFEREKLQKLPRAMAVGGTALLAIIFAMALIGILFSQFLPIDAATMILAFSIGGLAEMVLTARFLELDMAIVAAFQATRAVLVNSFAGTIWNWYDKRRQIKE